MSENQGSPSLLNNSLRGFRFQKKTLNLDETNGQKVRKRIKPMDDSSDSEGDNKDINPSTSNNSSSSNQYDCAYKEKQLRFLVAAYPNKDAMVLQDLLLKHDWDASKVINNMNSPPREIPPNTTGTPSITTNNIKRLDNMNHKIIKPGPKRGRKRRRSESENSNSGDSDFSNDDYNDSRVFDSDEDSDVEISNDLTGEKKQVLEFFQTATANELKLMATCSQKKVDAILQLRPFDGWIDLVQKLQSNKYLSTDLLNSAQGVLATRRNVQKLMKKCQSLAQTMERAIEAAGTTGIKNQPKLLNPELRLASYQMIGLNWLAVIHAQNVNGILADEMGLGKTIQVIAFLAYLKETGQAKAPHLIVVPSSTMVLNSMCKHISKNLRPEFPLTLMLLLDNWKNEFEKWCPSLKVFQYYGSLEERRSIRIDWSRGGLKQYDAVLTTYSMVTSTPEERKMYRITQFHYVVFDEAHMLKNMNTQRYENLIRIKAFSRILLTGTPLQNSLIELMSLLIFVMPGMFANKSDDLKNLFQKNSKITTAAASTDDDDPELPPFERTQVAQAKRIMKPFVLRRLKKDVLKDLPSKTEHTLYVEMDQSQAELYNNLIQRFKSDDASAVYSREAELTGIGMMMDLRKLSNHPLLLRQHYDYKKLKQMSQRLAKDEFYKENNAAYILDDLQVFCDFQIHKLTKEYHSISDFSLPDEIIVKSGKLQQLDKMLPQFKQNDHRVLIFSQFLLMLDIMEQYLKIKNIKFLRLDGATQVTTRQILIDEYTRDKSIQVFLLSTKAGGLGINLTAADTVIIHDIDFNPYNDKQAEDRCHRMGQVKPVTIYRFIGKGTIEEGMHEMAKEKLKLEKEITSNNEENGAQDVKCVAKLLTLALGFDSNKAAILLSSQSQQSQKLQKDL